MTRLRAAFTVAIAQLRHRWLRTLLGVIGVALAVVATVLLLSLGTSVLAVGDAGFTRIGGDLWMTAGSVGFAPGAVGGVETSIVDSHRLTRELEARDDVSEARALSFQSVYVGTTPGEYETVVGAGITGNGTVFETTAGRSFTTNDSHYANGSYDGQMTKEILIDRRAASQFGLEVGDTVHVGGTITAADTYEFEVVGISNDIARYLGTPTVMLPLGELQRISGKTGTDPSTALLLTVEDDTDPEAVQADLRGEYDDYEVRTNSEQFEAVLRSQSDVLASAVTIVVIAVVGGIALVSNIMGLFVYQQQRVLAALRAIGVSSGFLLWVVIGQGIVIAAAGTALGLGIALPALRGINWVVAHVVGFEDIIAMPQWTMAVGGGIAMVMGLGGSLVAGVLVVRTSPLRYLD